MKRVLMGLAALPFCVCAASAAQPLTNRQMDHVTAGFSAVVIAAANGQAAPGELIQTGTKAMALIEAVATATTLDATITLYRSNSAAQSSSFVISQPFP